MRLPNLIKPALCSFLFVAMVCSAFAQQQAQESRQGPEGRRGPRSTATILVGDHADSNTTTFLESEFSFTGMRWIKLDVNRAVTVGAYGPIGEASSWVTNPDLSKVDEVGFADLMPGSGHGSGGWVNLAEVEVYGKAVPREAASSGATGGH